ncbi:MAG: NAD(P)/FAD-dependent oxidoreductase [Candidatus Taylorbacteria bacterium]|nr:NAD(P)/FAD-dependent oxidoreductase [Candidatus Taylorbacteria bacterium]
MNEKIYDVIVIGGGASGMIAAGRAAELGKKVLLLEKNKGLGKKLLITGGGRCNITNAEFDTRSLIEKYNKKGQFLFSAFSRFGVQDTFNFFESRGLQLKVEAEKRAFPITDRARSVYEVLYSYLEKNNVEIRYEAEIYDFDIKSNKIECINLKKGKIKAKSYIIATGGKSRPETGSTGDGFVWLSKMGHKIIEPNAALVPIKIKDEWVKELQGSSLVEVRISVFQNDEEQDSQIGKLLFTHFGISGPLALNMSQDIQEIFKYGSVTLCLDLFPNLQPQDLDKKLQEIWQIEQNKKFKNSLGKLVTPKLAPIIARLSGIDPEIYVNKISRESRLRLIKLVKSMKMEVSGFLDENKAITTSGGISLDEVDFKTMQSKLISNLYLAGDILDFDRPSGGFSLQICWTTGYLAGENA